MTADAPIRRMVIDRFEGDVAVVELESGDMLGLPRWLLPPGAAEGDVIEVCIAGGDEEARIELRLNRQATARARADAEAALARLRQRDPGGDIEL